MARKTFFSLSSLIRRLSLCMQSVSTAVWWSWSHALLAGIREFNRILMQSPYNGNQSNLYPFMLMWRVLKHCLSLALLVLHCLLSVSNFPITWEWSNKEIMPGVLTPKGDLDWHRVTKRLKEREEVKRKDRDICRCVWLQDFTEVGVLGVMTPSEPSCKQNWRSSLCQEA